MIAVQSRLAAMTILRAIFWFSLVAFLLPQAPGGRQSADLAGLIRRAVVWEFALARDKLDHRIDAPQSR